MTTTRGRLDDHVRFDLPLRDAHERIAGLHAPPRPPTRPRIGRVGTVRDAIGAWLIGLGAALVSDEALRQRVISRTGRPVP